MSQNTSTALVANNLPIPSALGSLDAYIGAVHQIPVLSVEDEQRLAHRLRVDFEAVLVGEREDFDQAHRVGLKKIVRGQREAAAVEAMHRGVDDYLLKDNMARLAHVVERALEVREIKGGEVTPVDPAPTGFGK